MEGSERKRYNRQNKKRKVMTKEKVRSKILGLSDSFVKLYYDGRVGKREKCNMQDKRKEKKRQDKPQVKLLWTQHKLLLLILLNTRLGIQTKPKGNRSRSFLQRKRLLSSVHPCSFSGLCFWLCIHWQCISIFHPCRKKKGRDSRGCQPSIRSGLTFSKAEEEKEKRPTAKSDERVLTRDFLSLSLSFSLFVLIMVLLVFSLLFSIVFLKATIITFTSRFPLNQR